MKTRKLLSMVLAVALVLSLVAVMPMSTLAAGDYPTTANGAINVPITSDLTIKIAAQATVSGEITIGGTIALKKVSNATIITNIKTYADIKVGSTTLAAADYTVTTDTSAGAWIEYVIPAAKLVAGATVTITPTAGNDWYIDSATPLTGNIFSCTLKAATTGGDDTGTTTNASTATSLSVYASSPQKATEATECSINLTDETITMNTAFKYNFYSLDGGTKWKKGTIKTAAADFAKYLKKDLTLWFAIAPAANKTVDAAKDYVVKFPLIAAKPKAPKYAISYLAGEIVEKNTTDGLTFTDFADVWALASKDTMNVAVTKAENGGDLMVALEKDKKYTGWATAASGSWSSLADVGSDGKQVKTTYGVRIKEFVKDGKYYAASATAKVKVAGLSKPTALKADYKKEIVKLKAGVVIFDYDLTGKTLAAKVAMTVVTKDTAKTGFAIAPIMGEAFYYRTVPTAKKPGSAPTLYKLALRSEGIKDGTYTSMTVAKDKVTLDKKYEVANPEKEGKWGGMPKLAASALGASALPIRVKSIAKAQKIAFGTTSSFEGTCGIVDDSKQVAAGTRFSLHVLFGTNAKGKSVPVSATITSVASASDIK